MHCLCNNFYILHFCGLGSTPPSRGDLVGSRASKFSMEKKIAATSNFFLQLEHIQRYNRVKNLAQKVPGFKNTGSAVGAKLVRKKN